MISYLDQDFSALNDFLAKKQPSKLFFLVDENTHNDCLPILLANLSTEIPFEIIEIEAGEELKNIATATQLWEILAENEANRKALLINLGGGVITDLGGFVASTYKRGIAFVNVPTSLLGMCDASIGGKTGIDLNFLKNLVGTFSTPEKIFLYPDFLETLPFTELRSGFAEMLKHGLIRDAKHWEELIAIPELTVTTIKPHIERSMQLKQEVVTLDFKEQNVRKTLNFGHTFGHAVESLFLKNQTIITHGEAVALGMICETHLSYLQKLISSDVQEIIINNIQKYFPYISIAQFGDDEIISLMKNDKKNDQNTINFSLIESIGKGNFDQKVSENQLLEVLQFYRNLGGNIH